MKRNFREKQNDSRINRFYHHPYNTYSNYYYQGPHYGNRTGINHTRYPIRLRHYTNHSRSTRKLNKIENRYVETRAPSPFKGTEEYTQKKIQETSDMIKRQLMSSDDTPPIDESNTLTQQTKTTTASKMCEEQAAGKPKKYKSSTCSKPKETYNVRAIHNEIINHISKLSHGKKQKLVNADNTELDTAIEHIYKQKSLELSKALRYMSCQRKPEASEIVNAIIPDFAIKFEDLPTDVIRELSSTFEHIEENILPDAGNDDSYSKASLSNFVSTSKENEDVSMCIKREPLEFFDDKSSEKTHESNDYNAQDQMKTVDETNCQSPNAEQQGNAENAQNDECNESNRINFHESPNILLEFSEVENDLNETKISPHIMIEPSNRINTISQTVKESVISIENTSSSEECSLVTLPIKFHEPKNDSNDSIQSSSKTETSSTCSKETVPTIDEFKSLNEETQILHSNNSYTCSPKESLNKYVSIEIKTIYEPENMKEAAEMMLEVDEAIDKLTQLRKNIILKFAGSSLIEMVSSNSQQYELEVAKHVKHTDHQIVGSNVSGKLEKIREKFDKLNETSVRNDQIDKVQQKIDPNKLELEKAENVLTCLTIPEKNTLLASTSEGRLLYFDLTMNNLLLSFHVGSSIALDHLEYYTNCEESSILAAKTAEPYLNILPFKKMVGSKILLADNVQKIQKDGKYIFIGGSNGYLIRFNFCKNKIEFEDRIWDMSMKDMKLSKEGARKILVILFFDSMGNYEIHVRDCMSGLYIRKIGDINRVNNIALHDSSIYTLENHSIKKYNFCTGTFLHGISTFSLLFVCLLDIRITFDNNFLILFSYSLNREMFIFDVRNSNFIGPLDCSTPSSIFIDNEKVIFFTISKSIKMIDITDNSVRNTKSDTEMPFSHLQKLFQELFL